MRRLFFLPILLALLLTSCSKTAKPYETVKQFSEAMKSLDEDGMKLCFSQDSSFSLEILNGENVLPLMDYFRGEAAEIQYSVYDTEIAEDQAIVTMIYDYRDSGAAFKAAKEAFVEASVSQALSGETDIASFVDYYEKEAWRGGNKADARVEFSLVKEGEEWNIREIDESIYDVMLCGFPTVVSP